MRRFALATACLLALAGCKQEPDVPKTTHSFFSDGGAQGAAVAAAGGAPTQAAAGTGKLPPGHPPIGAMKGQMDGQMAAAGPVTDVVSGTITIDPKLVKAKKVPRGVLFIYGRMPGAAGKSGPPVLVVAVHKPTFPYTFDLTSRNTMMPGIPIPATVDLEAHLDQDGDAVSRTPGDLYGGVKKPVKKGTKGIKLVLDTVNTETRAGINVGGMGGMGGGGGMPAGHPPMGGTK